MQFFTPNSKKLIKCDKYQYLSQFSCIKVKYFLATQVFLDFVMVMPLTKSVFPGFIQYNPIFPFLNTIT